MGIKTKELDEMVANYKTIKSKKAFLTRLIKAQEEYYKDVKEAYDEKGKRPFGMLFGEKVWMRDVENALNDILVIQAYKYRNFGN